MAGGLGFEPRQAESESAVLPLDDPPRPGGKPFWDRPFRPAYRLLQAAFSAGIRPVARLKQPGDKAKTNLLGKGAIFGVLVQYRFLSRDADQLEAESQRIEQRVLQRRHGKK